jgi:hypothetical protein
VASAQSASGSSALVSSIEQLSRHARHAGSKAISAIADQFVSVLPRDGAVYRGRVRGLTTLDHRHAVARESLRRVAQRSSVPRHTERLRVAHLDLVAYVESTKGAGRLRYEHQTELAREMLPNHARISSELRRRAALDGAQGVVEYRAVTQTRVAVLLPIAAAPIRMFQGAQRRAAALIAVAPHGGHQA